MREEYDKYRSYGHGPVISFMLATPFWVIVAVGIASGIVLMGVR